MAEADDDYPCSTQDGFKPTFDVRIVSKPKSDGKMKSLVIGTVDNNKLIVPRWDIRTQPSQKLRFFVRRDTFQAEKGDLLTTAERAQFAVDAMTDAAEVWNQVNFGLSIVPTEDKSTANFNVVYHDPISPEWTAYASSFFPHRPGQDIIIYRKALLPDNRAKLQGVLMHEIGHLLGLRHEFALTGDGKRGPEKVAGVQFMDTNPISVMSYSNPPIFQETDAEGVKSFYGLENGFMVADDTPIKDITPWKRIEYPETDETVSWLIQEYGTTRTQEGQPGTSANPPNAGTDTQPTNEKPVDKPQGKGTTDDPQKPLPIPTPAKPTIPVVSPSKPSVTQNPVPTKPSGPVSSPPDKGLVANPANQGAKAPTAGTTSVPHPPVVTGVATTVGDKVVVSGPAAPVTASKPTAPGLVAKPAVAATVTKPPVKVPAVHS